MSDFKLCPLIVGKKEHKAYLRGQGDYTVPVMYPCIKEKCMAYDNDGMCCYWLKDAREKAEKRYTPEEVGEILIAEAQEHGVKWGDITRFTPSEVIEILKAETRNQERKDE